MKQISLILFLLQTLFLNAQAPADVDLSFGLHPGFNGDVNTIATQPDGKILVGGSFITYKGIPQNYFIRLNSDGTKDATFDVENKFNNNVYTIQLQPDGKILVGGGFTTFQGVTQNYIIRLNTDGSKDDSFNIGTGFDNIVQTIQLQPDGKMLVGGAFTMFQGIPQDSLIRLNADGSKDNSFNIGTGENSNVDDIQLQPDGKILIPTYTYQGINTNGLIRLNSNGSIDNSFNIGSGFNSGLFTIKLQPDGKILATGPFTTYQGIAQNKLIRLNTDGSKDASFIIGSGLDYAASSIESQADGKILLGGRITSYQGQTIDDVIRLNTDGSIDTTFNTNDYFGEVKIIHLQSDGKVLVGGNFISNQGEAQCGLTRLDANGTKDSNFSTGNGTSFGFNGSAFSILSLPSGKTLVGGTFNFYNGLPQNHLIMLNDNGSIDSSFYIDSGFNGPVSSLVQQPDGKIIVGGSFTTYQGQSQFNLIRLNADGTIDTSFNIGTGFNSTVYAIELQPDGKLLVGGWFTTYQGQSQNGLVRLNTDGSKDTTFNIGSGFNGYINDIKIQSDGKILVGGFFYTFQGQTQFGLIRLNADGSKDTSFNIGSNTFTGWVSRVLQQNDGKIIVTGTFSYNSEIFGIVRLNLDGSRDTTFNAGTGFPNSGSKNINAAYIQADGKILAGGYFTSYNGQSQNHLIRFNTDGTKDTSFDIGDGFNQYINDINVQPDGKIWVAGQFDIYNNTPSASLVRLYGNSLAVPEFDTTKISLYPNPVNDVLSVNAITPVTALQVYDIQGKFLIGNKNLNSIDVSKLNPGIYLLKVKSNENWITKKFIIK